MIDIMRLIIEDLSNIYENAKETKNKLTQIVDKVKHTNVSNTLEANLKYLANENDISSKIIEIPINKLISHQMTVTLSKVMDMGARKSIDKPVIVYKINDMFIITDGNHRANALLNNGINKIKAKLYDLDSVKSDSIDNFKKILDSEYKVI